MIFLTFDTEAKANAALQQINDNFNYAIIGRNALTGELDLDKQVTTQWHTVIKAYNIDKWYFLKPAEEKMTNVVDFIEEEFDAAWVEPIKTIN